MEIQKDYIFKQLLIGPMRNYAYIIGDPETKEIGIVDPGWEAESFLEEIRNNGYVLSCILLTHGHYDHVDAVAEIVEAISVPVYLSKQEMTSFAHPNLVLVEDRQKISIGSLEIECILTPGHSSGGQCFYYDNLLFTGDTLFVNACGRCDLPGGDVNRMYDSLYNVIGKLPDDTLILSGHGYGRLPYDTLGNQKKTNPYLTCSDKEEFISERM